MKVHVPNYFLVYRRNVGCVLEKVHFLRKRKGLGEVQDIFLQREEDQDDCGVVEDEVEDLELSVELVLFVVPQGKLDTSDGLLDLLVFCVSLSMTL